MPPLLLAAFDAIMERSTRSASPADCIQIVIDHDILKCRIITQGGKILGERQ